MKEKQPIITKPPAIETSSLSSQLLQLSEQSKQKEIWQDEVKIKIQTKGIPFMMMFLSDLHIGSKGVDYEALKEYLQFIKDYPVYIGLVGDLADNFSAVSHPTAIQGQTIQPTEQWSIVRSFFKEYQDKILVNTGGGQHDEWLVQKSGLDIFRWLTEDCNIPLLKSGGLLRLQVDNQEYKVRLYHQIAKLNSQFNLTHAGLQSIRLSGDDADMVVSADKHIGGLTIQDIGNKKRVVCQLGTFKVEDSYGRSKGFVQKPKPFYPVFFFFQGQHNIEAVEDLHQAKEIVDMMKRHYKQTAVASLGLVK